VPSPYSEVIKLMTEPILEHIDVLPKALFFFLEGNKDGIFMHHGISDKGYHRIERLKKIKHLLYPGPTWKEKLIRQGIPAEKIHIVGWPRLDPIFQGKIKYTPGEKKRIAWCPTHNAIPEISSYPEFEKHLDIFSDKYEVISSVHPARRQDRKTSLDVLVNADVVISDTSSILYEAMAIGKPVILLDFMVKDGVMSRLKGTFEEDIYREEIGYHAKSLEELPEIVELALEKGIDDKARKFIDGIFPPELRGKSGEATAKILKELMVTMSFNCPHFVGEFKDYVKSLEGVESILEVGAFSGELMDAVGGMGIDVNPRREDVDKRDIRKFKGKRRDLVFSSGLIEHYSPEEAVEVLRAMAKASNKYVLTYVPNTNCKAYRQAKAKTKASWKDELDFTPETLAELHEKAGMTVIDKGTAAAEWAKRFGPEPNEGYLVYVLARTKNHKKEGANNAMEKNRRTKNI